MVATTVKWKLLGAFLALVGVSVVSAVLMVAFYQHGIQKGIDMYHNQCYNFKEGFVVRNNQVVKCEALTTIPDSEMKKFNEGG